LLTCINESSSDSNKSDKSDDGSDNDTEKKGGKEEIKETKRSETRKEGWNPLQDLPICPLNRYSSYSDLSLTMPIGHELRIISQPFMPQYFTYQHGKGSFENEYKISTLNSETMSEWYFFK
jgi:hypothetical protein